MPSPSPPSAADSIASPSSRADAVVDIDLELDVTGALARPSRAAPRLAAARRLGRRDRRRRASAGCTTGGRRNATLVAAVLDLAAVVRDHRRLGVACAHGHPPRRSAAAAPSATCSTSSRRPAGRGVGAPAKRPPSCASPRSAVAVPVFERTTKTLYEPELHRRGRARRHRLPPGDLSDAANHFVWGDSQRQRADRDVDRRRRTWRTRSGARSTRSRPSIRSTIGSGHR